jgi:hypothetical protein
MGSEGLRSAGVRRREREDQGTGVGGQGKGEEVVVERTRIVVEVEGTAANLALTRYSNSECLKVKGTHPQQQERQMSTIIHSQTDYKSRLEVVGMATARVHQEVVHQQL